MAFCTQNLTIGIYTVQGSGVVELENNRLVGLVGNHFDKYLTYKNERNCQFKSAFFFNEQLDQNDVNIQNISAVRLMEKGELDFHAVPQDLGFANSNLETSKIITVSSIKVGHFIDKPNKLDKSNFLSFFINNLSVLIVLLIGYCLTKMFIYLYFKLRMKSEFKFFNLFLINLRNRFKLSKVSLIILSFSLFAFLNLSLLSNSIKTEKVILKTDKFIDSFEKLGRTSKILTFHEDESKMFTQAPYKSFFYQLYQNKVRKNEIHMISSTAYNEVINFYSAVLKNGLPNYIFLMDKTKILASIRILTTYAKKQFLYIRSSSFYEGLNCYYLSSALDKKRKQVLSFRINGAFENGLFLQNEQRIDEDLKLSILKDLKIFESLKEFISEYTSNLSNVQLDNYRTIFFCYFVILILIFIIFIFHHIYKLTKRKLVTLDRFHFFIKKRSKKAKKKVHKIQKSVKTSRPIYRTNIIVINE